MKTSRRQLPTLRLVGLVLLALVVGLARGILLDCRALSRATSAADVPAGTQPGFELLVEAWHIIQRDYVSPEAVNPRRMAHGAIGEMAQTLGDAGRLDPRSTQQSRRSPG